MNNDVREFIEKHIDKIESGNYVDLYKYLYEDMYNNKFVSELTNTLMSSNIDVSEAREELLYKMLEEFCEEATYGDVTNFHRLLDNENNWYGYDIFSIIDFFEQMSYNLGVKLVPIDDKIFNAQNYMIVSL